MNFSALFVILIAVTFNASIATIEGYINRDTEY